ncbi:2-Hydroxyacid oxidase-like [Uranotaenia lowii]|uniref:2-Hydroxyacid oxidase-like n=1 Tax=Uranotaenia lowii TaxID=190385 RepID=UPI00247A76CC|nr:2-Hydroxyacid oxidase-like [Uranotaenia lowii]
MNQPGSSFGRRTPFGLAPSSPERQSSRPVEIGAASIAEELRIPYICNVFSSTSLDDVSRIAPKTVKWMEIYPFSDRAIMEYIVQQVEQASFQGIILNINDKLNDSKFQDIKELKNTCAPPLLAKLVRNFKSWSNPRLVPLDAESAKPYLDWMNSITKLPIILKGKFSNTEMKLLYGRGVFGICQVFTQELWQTLSAVELLHPTIVSGDVIFEEDVNKVLEAGADFVIIERPIQWGFQVDGEAGIHHIIQLYEKNRKPRHR